jgi:hypothetical protein
MSHQHLEIVPSNVTSDGTLSFRNGQPVIQFIIGESDKFVLGDSIRFTGNFQIFLADGTLSTAADSLTISQRLGIWSCIDQLVIKSQRTNQVIEHLRNYNRFMSSYLSATSSLQDGLSHSNMEASVVPNPNAVEQSVVNNTGNLGKNPNEFCVSLPCGFFNGGQAIPLASDWGVGGLIVELHLAPDNNVLFAKDGDVSAIGDAYYQFKNVALTCEAQIPQPEDLSKLRSLQNQTFEYNSFSSYYTTVNSGNAIINFNLGLKSVLGVFCNFIPSNYINNLAANGLETLYPINSDSTTANVTQLIFTRGGERFPLEYNIDTVQSITSASDNTTIDAQIYRNYINSIQSFSKNMRNSYKPENMKLVNASNANTFIDGGCGYGIGVALDTISNAGVDFSSTNFGINMTMDLVTDFPQSVYMFVHSKNTLVFNQSGLEVMK